MPVMASIAAARRAELILHEVESLPTLPSVATRLMKAGSGDDADLQEIIKLIEMDPTLTAKILSMCRRANLGMAARVTTVKRAVVLLGLETVQSMALGVQVFEWSATVSGGKHQQAGPASQSGTPPAGGAKKNTATFDRIGFWQHSIAVACCAEMIAAGHREFGVRAGEAFVAGLLHDLGKLALELILPQAYQRVIELSEHRLANIADVEQRVIGLDHHTAGKRLAERWELPPMLRDVIWLHGQRPDAIPAGPYKKLIGVVHVADAVCRGLHLGWSGNHTVGEPLADVCGRVGLNAEKIEHGLPDLLKAVKARCTDLGLSDQPSERMVLDALAAANRRLSRLGESSNRRARAAQEQSRVLEEVNAFVSRMNPEKGVVEVVTAIGASAAKVFGPGRYVAVVESASKDDGTEGCAESRYPQTSPPLPPRERRTIEPDEPSACAEGSSPSAGPLVVLAFGEDGRRISCDVVDVPDDAASDFGIARGARLSLAGLRSIVAARAVLDAPGASVLNLLPRAETDGANNQWTNQGGAVLVHDRDEVVARLGTRLLGVLTAVWGSALSSAMREEASGRASEELAGINQRLAHAEQQLAQAESMARLAELTAGAAHEFNNPLAIICGRGQQLELGATDPAQKNAASAVVRAAQTLSDLVRRLHVIAKPPEPVMAPTNLDEVHKEAVDRAMQRASRNDKHKNPAAIRVTVADGLGLALMDRELMVQALVEVLVNAIESEPSDFVSLCVQTDPVDDRLLIQVTDTGRGMSEHALKHAMDPFFSEKPAGRQSGLGLALAQRLLGLHGGSISMSSTPGDGTIVTIALDDWRWAKQAARIAA